MGVLFLSKPTRTRAHIHNHSSSHTTTHSAPRKTTVRLAWLTDSRRTTDRNERLTVFSAASNKRCHSCPRHRCVENSSLISRAWADQRYLSSVIYWRNLGNASGPHLPSSGASSISARHIHLHSLPDSNPPAAATPTEWQLVAATRVTLFLPGR